MLKAQQLNVEVSKVRDKVKVGVEAPFWNLEDEMIVIGSGMYLLNNKILKNEVLNEAHESRFVVHLRSTKMYKDLKECYW